MPSIPTSSEVASKARAMVLRLWHSDAEQSQLLMSEVAELLDVWVEQSIELNRLLGNLEIEMRRLELQIGALTLVMAGQGAAGRPSATH